MAIKLKRYIVQAKVVQNYSKGKPLVWRIVDSFKTRAEAEAILPPNRPGEFRILDREKITDDFGTRFRAVCKEKGLTPAQAAELCGYRPYMGNYFTGQVRHPARETIERLSKGLGVPAYRLMGKEKEV